MILPLLALALAGAPPDLATRFQRDVCPDHHRPDDSNVELKRKMDEQVSCTRKAMNKELDRVIAPLKKKEPERFHAWMALQADYNAWIAATCTLAETLFWIDLDAGTRSDGTARSTTQMQCLIALQAHRGAFARALAEKEQKRLQRATEALRDGAPKAQAELDHAIAAAKRFRSVDAGPPERTAVELPLAPGEWEQLATLAEQVEAGPARLGTAQCALLPDWKDCASILPPALMALAQPSRYSPGE